MKQIIKGALYFTGDLVLRAHYTGNFFTVDCTEYKTKTQMHDEGYSESFIKKAINSECITVDGVKYFECNGEYSPHHTSTMLLLSDLIDVDYYDNQKEFTL